MTKDRKPKILFLCTGNSCRSQMAEGWAKHFHGEKYNIYSAGIEKHGMNAMAIKAMARAGVDISGNESNVIEELPTQDFDYVITVCDHANEKCPFFPAKTRVIHHGFDDPPKLAVNAVSEEEALGHYERVRNEIKRFAERLPHHLR
ncbi:MAG: arsenate reductase ArsC [Desulfobulbaceae bacterium]|uniref:Arsenate reductase ArsC n=1 Tax=Candidatus Desulfobia pelagia TaxID=2841692 RepID=A0A8J6NDN1_9BACT|nr:arsenate reductase ArsC [Candidatus Desulfobia pelagia]